MLSCREPIGTARPLADPLNGLDGGDTGRGKPGYTSSCCKILKGRHQLATRLRASCNGFALQAIDGRSDAPPFGLSIGKTSCVFRIADNLQNVKRLEGHGNLSPFRGSDGQIYGIAQGSVSVGGFSSGGGGGGVQKYHPTVGRVASGATVEKELDYAIDDRSTFEVNLMRPDFTTSRVGKRRGYRNPKATSRVAGHLSSAVVWPDPGPARRVSESRHLDRRRRSPLSALERSAAIDPDRRPLW
ncbi:MAG: hypothetical protein ACI8W3_001331 [Myxococcota bacterium]